MSDETTPEQLRRELREIDAEIAELRKSTDDLTAHVGPEGDGVEDAEEIAADLTSVEEDEAVLGILGQRREAVLKQLERLGGNAD
jgi:pyrimidine operon attenuation protein/uracil phosphoribosyltransferase